MSISLSNKFLKNQANNELEEMDLIFNMTKNFTVNFDLHMNKVQSLVSSLLETDIEEENIKKIQNKKRITFAFGGGVENMNRIKSSSNVKNNTRFTFSQTPEIKEGILMSNLIQNLENDSINDDIEENKSHNKRKYDLDISPKKGNFEENEKNHKSNSDNNFFDFCKVQTNALSKMMESGQENTKALRTIIETAFNTLSSQKDYKELSEKNLKYKDKIKNLKQDNLQLLEKNLEFKMRLESTGEFMKNSNHKKDTISISSDKHLDMRKQQELEKMNEDLKTKNHELIQKLIKTQFFVNTSSENIVILKKEIEELKNAYQNLREIMIWRNYCSEEQKSNFLSKTEDFEVGLRKSLSPNPIIIESNSSSKTNFKLQMKVDQVLEQNSKLLEIFQKSQDLNKSEIDQVSKKSNLLTYLNNQDKLQIDDQINQKTLKSEIFEDNHRFTIDRYEWEKEMNNNDKALFNSVRVNAIKPTFTKKFSLRKDEDMVENFDHKGENDKIIEETEQKTGFKFESFRNVNLKKNSLPKNQNIKESKLDVDSNSENYINENYEFMVNHNDSQNNEEKVYFNEVKDDDSHYNQQNDNNYSHYNENDDSNYNELYENDNDSHYNERNKNVNDSHHNERNKNDNDSHCNERNKNNNDSYYNERNKNDNDSYLNDKINSRNSNKISNPKKANKNNSKKKYYNNIQKNIFNVKNHKKVKNRNKEFISVDLESEDNNDQDLLECMYNRSFVIENNIKQNQHLNNDKKNTNLLNLTNKKSSNLTNTYLKSIRSGELEEDIEHSDNEEHFTERQFDGPSKNFYTFSHEKLDKYED